MRLLMSILLGAMIGYGLMGAVVASLVSTGGKGGPIALYGGLTVLLCIALSMWLTLRRPVATAGRPGLATRILGAVIGAWAFGLVGIALMLVMMGIGALAFQGNLSGLQAWLEMVALWGGAAAALGVPLGAMLAGR